MQICGGVRRFAGSPPAYLQIRTQEYLLIVNLPCYGAWIVIAATASLITTPRSRSTQYCFTFLSLLWFWLINFKFSCPKSVSFINEQHRRLRPNFGFILTDNQWLYSRWHNDQYSRDRTVTPGQNATLRLLLIWQSVHLQISKKHRAPVAMSRFHSWNAR